MIKLAKRFARRIEPGTPSLDTQTYVTFRPPRRNPPGGAMETRLNLRSPHH
ncbi:hypothetical protein RISK_000412 [Rhodopirellula islandica]|uniref:Uncharacterized protein n=1 Tax=Rhodopirellula islandica TaxID=595434 RepID=A0A0J1EPC7_RHOIS|nr:hypothetical protein RISK_000412 [Rhodopirellula islandica]